MTIAQEVPRTMQRGSLELDAGNGAHYMAHARACEAMALRCDKREERDLWLRIGRDWLRVAGGEVDAPPRTGCWKTASAQPGR
jgi:hypothetical protein